MMNSNMISNKTGRVLFILAALIAFVGALAGNVLAAEEVQAAVQAASGELREFGLAIGAGLGLGLAAAGGALAQGRAVSSAMEGLSRNPQASDRMFLPLILGLVFIESLVIYTLVIAFFLQGKI
ncbi:MAG: ATP synthase F0 subunit C [Candidatus Calescibacterium sp.]